MSVRPPRYAISGLVLAGGSSQRMGRDKAFLDVGGRTLIERVLDALRPVCGEIILAVASGEGGRFSSVLGNGVRLAEDSAAGRGPIEGMRAGFSAARGTKVAVAPVDAPMVTARFYRLLLGLMQGHDAAVPYPSGMPESLLAVYSRRPMLAAIEKVIALGGLRPAQALQLIRVRNVDRQELSAFMGPLGPFANINTPSDLGRARDALAIDGDRLNSA